MEFFLGVDPALHQKELGRNFLTHSIHTQKQLDLESQNLTR